MRQGGNPDTVTVILMLMGPSRDAAVVVQVEDHSTNRYPCLSICRYPWRPVRHLLSRNGMCRLSRVFSFSQAPASVRIVEASENNRSSFETVPS